MSYNSVNRLDVNNIKNGMSSKGVYFDKIIAYLIMFLIGYISFVVSRNFGISISYWIASIGFPILFMWYLLFKVRYENQPYYQLIAPFINFISTGNKRKTISQSAIEIFEPSVLINRSNSSLIGLLRVYPKNIFTLKEDDRVYMTQRYANEFLNNLRNKRFELVLRNRTATVMDYKDYFDYYINYPEVDRVKLTALTQEHLKIHLLEFEEEINKGYLKFKELYLEIYAYTLDDRDEDSYQMESEFSCFQSLLKNVDINSRKLTQKETEEYIQKFVIFKSTEEIESQNNLEIINKSEHERQN